MTAEEFSSTIIEKLQREPFVPFAIELHDGKVIEFDAPMSIAVRPGDADVVGMDRNDQIMSIRAAEAKSVFDLAGSAAAV